MPDFRIPTLPPKPPTATVGPGWLFAAWCPDDDTTYRVDYEDLVVASNSSANFPSLANQFGNGQPPFNTAEDAIVWMLQNWLNSTGQPNAGTSPSVAISANPQTLQAGQDVEFTVLAIPASGVNIAKVQIKNGTQLLYEFPAGTTTFKWVWKSVAQGNYSIQAVATDSGSNTGKSNIIALPVTSATTNPPANQPVAPIFSGFDDVANTVSVSHPTLAVSELAYDFNGATGISVPNNNVISVGNAAGQVTAYARATAGRPEGVRANSQPFTVANNNAAPQVSLASPQAGQTLAVGEPVVLNATATDDVAVVKVEYLEDGIKFTETTVAPHTVQRNIPSSGTHNYTARAIDGGSPALSTLSNSISVTGAAAAVSYDSLLIVPPSGAAATGNSISFAADASAKVEFDKLDDNGGQPIRLELLIGGSIVAILDFSPVYLGKRFRFTTASGQVYSGTNNTFQDSANGLTLS